MTGLEPSGPPRWVFVLIMSVVLVLMGAWGSYLAYERGYAQGVKVATDACSSSPAARQERSERRFEHWGQRSAY